uniref:Uncharacterized protein n=1 Tax=Nymphaea colorata TaxID=210225 RepID=A0A5K1F8D2_9MAGN|nr:unnamed protein product [Nymphaea colorata]
MGSCLEKAKIEENSAQDSAQSSGTSYSPSSYMFRVFVFSWYCLFDGRFGGFVLASGFD